MKTTRILLAAACALGFAGGANAQSAPAGFTDVSATAGITTVGVCGADASKKPYILEVNGCGAALFDADGDGDLDVWLTNGSTLENYQAGKPGAGNALWRNDGGFRFTDVTANAGIGGSRWGTGVAVGDVDNDGDVDVFVSEFGADLLYINDGKGSFVEVGKKAGVADPRWSTSAVFFDADRDGKLDLFVCNYLAFDPADPPPYGGSSQWRGKPVMRGPRGLTRDKSQLYMNIGSKDGVPAFEDRTEESGIGKAPASYALGVTAFDFDLDGDDDIFVANDSEPYFLFVNDGHGRFTEKGQILNCATDDHGGTNSGMGVSFGDFDGDGRFDLAVTNFSAQPDNVFRFDGKFFEDVSLRVGVGGPTMPMLGWGCRFLDADLDGRLDLFICNGHVYPEADKPGTDTTYAQRCQYFENIGNGKLKEVPGEQIGLAERRLHRGAAFGDLDGDGDEDVIVTRLNGPPLVLRNDLSTKRGWIAFDLEGTASARSGYGAIVRITAGGRERIGELQPGSSFQCSNEPVVRFGLNDLTAVDSVEIRWPSGAVDRLGKTPGGQRVRVREGSSPAASRPK